MDSHTIFDALSLLIAAGGVYVGLLIKNILYKISINQLHDKAELLRNQTEIKETLVNSVSDLRSDLDVHKAEDRGEFRNIHESLIRIEGKKVTA